MGEELHRVIPVIQLYQREPWHLPMVSGESCQGDTEQWFFFTPRQQRGGRPIRTTVCGYWKATGSPGYVYSSANRVIGVKKTMVFYKGKAPTGIKTKWKMNEYKAIEEAANQSAVPTLRHEFSLCRVYVTSGNLRAFDRRPLVAAPREKQPHGDGARAFSPGNIMGHANDSKTSFKDAMIADGDVAITSAQNNTMVNGCDVATTSAQINTMLDVDGDVATTSSQNNILMVARTSSPDTSYPGPGEDHADLQETNWMNLDDLELPLWDWDHLINWPKLE